MKTITTGCLGLLFYFGTAASAVWIIVEFLIYLVKDKPFNWMSLWCFLALAGSSVIFLISSFVLSHKSKIEEIEENKENKRPTSRFQQRLAEMEKQRNKFNN
jgi:hypothetical protein